MTVTVHYRDDASASHSVDRVSRVMMLAARGGVLLVREVEPRTVEFDDDWHQLVIERAEGERP